MRYFSESFQNSKKKLRNSETFLSHLETFLGHSETNSKSDSKKKLKLFIKGRSLHMTMH